MVKTIYYCDKCKQEISYKEYEKYKIEVRIPDAYLIRTHSIALCKVCNKQFYDWYM